MHKINSDVRNEAIKRLKLLSEQFYFPKEILEDYLHNGKVYTLNLIENTAWESATYTYEDIAYLEDIFNCHIYFVMKDPKRDIDFYFFVSNNAVFWEIENRELEYMSPHPYVVDHVKKVISIGRLNLKWKGAE